MLGGVVDGESSPNLRSPLGAEGVGQGLFAMDIEVVHHQVDLGGLRIRHSQLQDNQCELKPGSVRRGKAEVLARFGLHGKKRVRRSTTLVFAVTPKANFAKSLIERKGLLC